LRWHKFEGIRQTEQQIRSSNVIKRKKMNKRIIFATVILLMVSSILACEVTFSDIGGSTETIRGSGDVIEENRSVSDISSVELAMQGSLSIEIGSTEALRIEAEDNLLEYIETQLSAGRLVIKSQNGVNLRNTEPINYFLTVTGLDSIRISSSGDIQTPDLQAERFSITISSSGDLTMGDLDCTSLSVESSSSGILSMGTLTAETIDVRISSSGNVEIDGGQVQKQDITITSSGEYRAEDLASAEAEVTLTSSGTARIRVSDQLSGRLSSSGNIYYIGDPKVSVSTTSSGKAVQVDE
jgi:hypothetical protein